MSRTQEQVQRLAEDIHTVLADAMRGLWTKDTEDVTLVDIDIQALMPAALEIAEHFAHEVNEFALGAAVRGIEGSCQS